ncbi:MAG: 50S ribosomal protein L11 methyltransferase [Oscillospiraceae bacterium]
MDWTELAINVPTKDTQTAADIATMTVPYGFYIEDYSDMEELLPQIGHVDFIDEELQKKDKTHSVLHIYIPKNMQPLEAQSFITERLTAEGIEHSVVISKIDEDKWANCWKKYYKPERIGNRLVICPSWEKYTQKEGDIVLSLDPQMAFGTGKHETTRLCLELLEQTVETGGRILDMGCGSGILSVAALAFGAKEATGCDIDKNSVAIACENARINGFDDGVFTGFVGDVTNDTELENSIGSGYDIIVANIVADVIIGMKDIFFKKLKQSGCLIVSGIIDSRSDEVAESLTLAGFELTREERLRNWVALSLKKKKMEK